MSSGDVVGTAIVNLKSNSSGFLSDLSSAFSQAKGLSSGLGKDITSSLSSAGSLMTAGITVPILAIGAAAVSSAETVDGAYHTIQNQTGATGATLTSLKGSFDTVFANVPQDAQTVSTALATVHDKFGILGTDLDTLTQKFLDWARISGADVNTLITDVNAWSSQWNMSAAQTSTSMDAVNTAAQDTGVSSQNLADSLKLVAPAASNLKIPFNDAVYDMALFQGAGLKTTAVNTAMQKTFTDAAKSGQDANTRWTEDVATLQTYVTQGNNAGISTKAWTQLTDDFGTRSLPTMTAGLKDGSTKFQNLKTDIDNGKPSIENTAAATETFSQKFDTLKHSVELALAPLGTTMITTLTNVGTTLKPVLSAVETLGKDFSALPAPVQTTILVIGLAVAALGPMLSAVNYVAGALTTMGGIVTTVGTKLGILSADEATTGTATATMSGEVDTATVSLTAEGAAGDTAATGLDASATAAVGAEGAMVGLSTAIAGVVVAYYALKVSAQLADTAVKQTNADAKASTGGDSTVTSKPPSSTTENTTVPGYGQLNVAATGGLVTASGIQHFAGGGMVDTVPAMLTPGELVLTPGQAGALASGGGNYTFNIAFNNATLTSQADADNFSRQIAWSAKEEIRRSGVSRG